jgi:hypothetical protein
VIREKRPYHESNRGSGAPAVVTTCASNKADSALEREAGLTNGVKTMMPEYTYSPWLAAAVWIG